MNESQGRQPIVMLTRSLPHHALGGMEVAAWDLAREFARLGYAVHVITTALPEVDADFLEEGVLVTPLAGTTSGRYSKRWWQESKRFFEKNYLSTKCSVISVSAAGFGLLQLKPRMKDSMFIMQAHGTSIGEIISKVKSRKLRSVLGAIKNVMWIARDLHAYSRFDLVVAVGEQVLIDLKKIPNRWALPERKVRLVNNGIDQTLFFPSISERHSLRQAKGIDLAAVVVISANRLHSQKGVAHGIIGFNEFLKTTPSAQYYIFGDGPEKGRLTRMAAELGISSHVHFMGTSTREHLAVWLRLADVFMFLTDRIEGLPLNILEALASGLPLVTSGHMRIFASKEITLVNQRDHRAVATALELSTRNRAALAESKLPEAFTLAFSAQKYIDLTGRRAGRVTSESLKAKSFPAPS